MNKKTMLIGLGVLAVAGIGYYLWKKKSETTSGAEGEEYSCAVRCGNGCWYKNCGLGHGKSLGCGTKPSA
jgi:LPXTG-motif cell wall-anchored protein